MEIKYNSIFKNEIKNFIAYEKINIQKTHVLDLKDMDRYFVSVKKKEKEITKEDYYTYINCYSKSIINKNRRYLIIFRFCKFLARLGYGKIFYERIAFDNNIKYQPKIYSDIEIKNIILVTDKMVSENKIDKAFSILYRILISTGMRISEALSIRVEDIDITKGYINIIESKGNVSRRIFLSKTMLVCLKKYLSIINIKEGKIFPITYELAKKNYDKILDLCNIKVDKKRLHDLRHTFITNALNKMINKLNMSEEESLIYLMAYVGHTDPKSTEYYLHMTKKMQNEIRNACNLSMYEEILGDINE